MAFKLINDIFHGNVEFSNFESSLLRHSFLNRLHQIIQNSTAFLVFPCDRTSRFEHSIGVMDYASKIFVNGLLNADEDCVIEYLTQNNEIIKKLREESKDNIITLLKSIDKGLGYDKVIKLLKSQKINNFNELYNNEIFKEIIKNFIGNEFSKRNMIYLNDNQLDQENIVVYLLLLQSIRAYALFHDLGHLPFSHLFERAIENVGLEIDKNSIKSNKSNKVIETIHELYNENNIHEVIGKNLIQYIFTEFRDNLINKYTMEEDDSKKIKYIGKIILLYYIQRILNEIKKGEDGKMSSLFKIVSGTVDADRLDFVQRDLFMSGLLNGSGNIERILKMFCLCKKGESDKFNFLPAIQSLNDVEEIIKDRYTLYKIILNHHAVRRTDHILQTSIEKIILSEIKDNNISNNNGLFLNKISDIILLLKKLKDLIIEDRIKDNFKRIVYQFSQVTDSWLMTHLNQVFINSYLKDDKSTICRLLEELFHNARSFKSLWKRFNNYKKMVEILGKKLRTNIDEKIVKIDDLDKMQTSKSKKINFENIEKWDNFTLGNKCIAIMKETRREMGYNDYWYKQLEKHLNNNANNTNNLFLVSKGKLNTGIKNLYFTDIKKQQNITEIDKTLF